MTIKIGIVSPIDVNSIKKIRPLTIVKGKVAPKGLGATFLTSIVEELISRGHEIIIFTLDRGIEEEVILKGENLKIYVHNYRETKRARNFFKNEIECLKEMIEKEKVDVLHAHWTYEFAIAALATKNEVLVTAHDSPFKVLRYMPNPYRFIRLLMAYYALIKTKKLTVVSKDTANHLKKYKFYSKKELYVIPNPVVIEEKLLRNSSGAFDKNEIVFASVLNGSGKLKNPIRLLKAYRELRTKYENVKLVMIGIDYEEFGPVHQWAKKNNADVGVEFKGAVVREELLQYLKRNVDVLVHPSLEESFSLIVAEAMKLSIPIIGGKKSGAVPYTMGEGIAGLLIDMRNVNEISRAMEQLMDSYKRKLFGIQGCRFATENYDLIKVVDKYEQLYIDSMERN
ncbi:glycosyltransferase family 4 protein [Bacillus cereus]|uniref:glycosyltransferase family 4 protein n=1 Tax=Bacillus cereus TaxID=1396 RepID=UPI002570605D|nr:glycosyltransferase family 4 protein [Bacillus cereus]WJE20185.1 glycosyltransferase family 4 protein [Bacillus cereus]